MADLRKAAELALEALEEIGDEWGFTSKRTVPNRIKAIQALRQALAQPDSSCNSMPGYEGNTYPYHSIF